LKTNQQFFRNSPGNPGGKISITGGVNAGLYSDLSSATSYIQSYTNAIITDTDLVNDVFRFTVPANSDFSLTVNFLNGVGASISDPDGLITKFSAGAFNGNTGNNLLGNCTFGTSFTLASGNNTVGNILMNSPFAYFANTFTGTFNIKGNIGTTEGSNYVNFFANAGAATINALISKQTSNAGGIEGDLALAQSHGATVNFIL
jgi:hypothetical protein